jgi:hypothetical protein
MPDEVRRFPPPWDIEEFDRSCFIVRDNSGKALAYVYFEQEPGRRTASNLLTRDEARRIARQYCEAAWAVGTPAAISPKRCRSK